VALAAPEMKNVLNKERGLAATPARGNAMRNLMLGTLLILLVVGAFKMMSGRKNNGTETVQVVAAKQDIAPGTRLSLTSLHYLIIPKAYLTSSMFSSYTQLAGKTTSNFVQKGEPFSKSDLLPANSLSDMLNADERAITLKLDPEMLLDHELGTGDRVDVLVSSTSDNKRYTRTICQNLRVLLAVPKAMMQSHAGRSNDANKVTLAANASECEKLNQAADTGKLRLLLRSLAAKPTETYLTGADQRDILPPFALKELAEKNMPPLAKADIPAAPPLAAQASAFPPPPPIEEASSVEARPVQWLVEMFSGSKREAYAVPTRQ
jgi:Flp pilus assembly protein CpaB